MTLRDLSKNTRRSYNGWLERLYHHAGCSLEQIHSDGVADFLHHLVTAEKLKASTLNQAFCGIRLYFRDYRKRSGNEWDIWDQFKIRKNKTLPHVLTQEEVQLLLSHIRKGRYRSVLTTMYLCGLRISEAVSLQPQSIIGKRKVVQILNSKGGKSREVPLCDELYGKLRIHWKNHRNPNWLFPSKSTNWRSFGSMKNALNCSSTHISPATLRDVFRIAARESGLADQHRKITPHTLRHSYATHLIENGACIRSVSAYLGHASLEATMIYLHMTQVSEDRARLVISDLAQKQFLPPLG